MEPKYIKLVFNDIHKYNFHRLWIYIFLFKNTSSTLNPYWWVILKNYNISFFMYNIFCCMMHHSVATYDYDLCYLHKVFSPWDINTYLLKYMATIHLPEKKVHAKRRTLWGFFEPFLPQQLPSFYSLSSAPSYYYSHTVLYFTPHRVYWQQCVMSQAAQESTIYWLLFPPVSIKRCPSWSHEVPWWILGWSEWHLFLCITWGSG